VRRLLQCKPRQTFRIHGERTRRGAYYQVAIFKTLAQFRRAANAVTRDSHDRRTGKPSNSGGFRRAGGLTHSCCIQRRTNGHWRTLHCAGFMLLCDVYMGAGYVTHECTHAATYLLLPQKLDIFNDPEHDEKFAWLTGQLVAEFWTQWYKRNRDV
jgi:hypothetical protein